MALDLPGVSYYDLFGYHDVLVRAWLPNDIARELINSFPSESTEWSSFSFFHATNLLRSMGHDTNQQPARGYIWSKPQTLVAFQTQPSNEQLAAELKESGLLLGVAPIDNSGRQQHESILFFVLAGYSSDTAPRIPTPELAAFAKGHGIAGVEIRDFALGSGFCNIVIGARAGDFARIEVFVSCLLTRFGSYGLGTNTYLCIRSKVKESDDLGFAASTGSFAARWAASAAQVPRARSGVQLSGAERRTLEEVADVGMAEVSPLELTKEDMRSLMYIFQACFLKDPGLIEYALTRLFHIERLLIEFLPLFMAATFGEQWRHDAFERILSKVSAQPFKAFKEMVADVLIPYLGEAVATARREKRDVAVKHLEKVSDWFFRLQKAKEYRDQFAHPRASVNMSDWKEIALVLVRVIPVMTAIAADSETIRKGLKTHGDETA